MFGPSQPPEPVWHLADSADSPANSSLLRFRLRARQMAPKTGRATGKAKGKAAPKPLAKRPATTSKPAAVSKASTAGVSAQHPQKPRQISRRDTDEKVARAMQAKLAHIPASILEGKRNGKGESSCKQGRFRSRIWCSVMDDFALTETLADGLAEPEEDQEASEELIEMIHLCRHENPATRRTSGLERHLGYCAPMNRTSLFGLLRSTQESPTLTKNCARKCQMAVLRYLCTTGHNVQWEGVSLLR